MVRVLVVDDSAVSRRLLRHILEADGSMRVVGEADDGAEALELTLRLRPDVITMDVVMRDVNGIEATRTIMQERATPVVVVTGSFSPDRLDISMRAIDAGALTVLEKPRGPGSPDFDRQATELARTVRLMSEVKVVSRRPPRNNIPAKFQARLKIAPQVLAIAASTGGPVALARLLGGLPSDLPVPVLLVQHISSGFDEGLCSWLNTETGLEVRFPSDGELLKPGRILLAPYDTHLGAGREGRVSLSSAPPVKGHRPSATHLFSSLATSYGPRSLAVILTGMGDDGAEGLLALKRAGGTVIAQDESTSVVYGMPRRALEVGAVDHVLPLEQIAHAITEMVSDVTHDGTKKPAQ